jgi:hypothetical protein
MTKEKKKSLIGNDIMLPKHFDLKTYYEDIKGGLKCLEKNRERNRSVDDHLFKKIAYIHWHQADQETRSPVTLREVLDLLGWHQTSFYQWKRSPDFKTRLVHEIHERGTGPEALALYYSTVLTGIAKERIGSQQLYQRILENKKTIKIEDIIEENEELKKAKEIVTPGEEEKLKMVEGGKKKANESGK